MKKTRSNQKQTKLWPPSSKDQKRLGLIFIVLALCVAVDQATKLAAEAFLKGHPAQIFLSNLFRLEYAENRGAFLSLGAGLSDSVRFWFLTVIVGAFTLGCLGYVIAKPRMDRLSTISFSLVIGGGISNLLDRLCRFNGHVVDFMNLGIGSLRTGIFNIADVVIMAGVIFLIFSGSKEASES